jgi:hypothetical protein
LQFESRTQNVFMVSPFGMNLIWTEPGSLALGPQVADRAVQIRSCPSIVVQGVPRGQGALRGVPNAYRSVDTNVAHHVSSVVGQVLADGIRSHVVRGLRAEARATLW